ncbi:MAG TPA: hypothetical protein VK745_18835 [Polyangiaceae bacterium]|nr:hypothetical protein [Polyangiaceae bacterium]
MELRRTLLLVGCLYAVACSGKVQTSSSAGSSGATNVSNAGASGVSSSQAGSNDIGVSGTGSVSAGSGGASSGSAGSGSAGGPTRCPALEPIEGSACPVADLDCNGFGSLSCPEIALCASNLTWQIECPKYPAGMMPGSCACPHPVGDSADAGSGRVPLHHRESESICSAPRAAITPTPNDSPCRTADGGLCSGLPCQQDSDCTQGVNGRCGIEGPAPFLVCTYDACVSDSDCAPGVPCQCRTDGASSQSNSCLLDSTCRVDADCGSNGFCSPSEYNQWCGPSYHCHTLLDTCTDDSDCTSSGCNFDATLGHWACGGGCGPLPP